MTLRFVAREALARGGRALSSRACLMRPRREGFMMEDEIKSTTAGEENQAEALAPSTLSEAAAAPAPTPSADVNASVPAPAPAATSAPSAPVATAPSAPVATAPFSAPAVSSPAAAQQGASASFCRNCGQALAAGDAFCPKCGTPCGVAGATPQPAAAPVNAAAAQPAKTKKKTPTIIVAILALVAIVVGAVAVNAKPKGPDFQALYDEYCSSPWAKVANDGSYLAIDSNPSDRKADSNIYIFEVDRAVKDINKALGFDESLYERMSRTNALAGMQGETGNGVRVSWDYHPKNGLEVTYSLDNE